MSVLLLGTGGFLGSRLAAHYAAKGEKTFSLSFRPSGKEAFLTECAELLAAEKPRAVINAGASQSSKDDPGALEDLISSNVLLPSMLASLILTHTPQTYLINFGTSWQFGEQGEPSPFNAYAASKAAAEAFIDHFALAGLKAATLHLYDTYGPGDPRGKIVNLITHALVSRTELPMSPGGQLIDLVHIDDVLAAVDATLVALEASQGGVHYRFAVRSGRPVRILDVLELLRQAADIESIDFIKPGVYPYRARERFGLFADTPTPPGWSARIDLAEGLKGVLETHRNTAAPGR